MMSIENPDQLQAMMAIRANLFAIVSYNAFIDYKRANPKSRMFRKNGTPIPHNPYTLSPVTNEARHYYILSLNDEWTTENEAGIKVYIMRLRRNGVLDKVLDWEMYGDNVNPWRKQEIKNGYTESRTVNMGGGKSDGRV